MVFLVRCHNCGNSMKYQPMRDNEIKGKVKRCVYCGKTFTVHSNVNSTRVLTKVI